MALRRFGTVLSGEENNAMAVKSVLEKDFARPRAALGDIGNKTRQTAKLIHKGELTANDTNLNKPFTKVSSSQQPSCQEVKENGVSKLSAFKSTEIMDMEEIGEALEGGLSEGVTDIDAGDHDNPQMCAEYVNDIYRYLRSLEKKFRVPANYMDKQTQINEKMRSILVDWLIQVHLRFRLLQETLFMTVSIIDRFLAVHDVSKAELQLVGVSAMLLASKYEEMYAPEIQDFVTITDNAYTKAQIRKMEALIFRKLGFNLSKPLCLHFLRRNSKAGAVDAKKHTLAKYFMELCLVDYQSVKFLPSEIAAAALSLSIKAIDNSEWNKTLEYYSSYSEHSLQPCMQRMAELVRIMTDHSCKWNAVPKKFASGKFMNVALLPYSRPSHLQQLLEC